MKVFLRADNVKLYIIIDGSLPELDETFLQEAVFVPGPKQQITLRIDQDVVEYCRSRGPGFRAEGGRSIGPKADI